MLLYRYRKGDTNESLILVNTKVKNPEKQNGQGKRVGSLKNIKNKKPLVLNQMIYKAF